MAAQQLRKQQQPTSAVSTKTDPVIRPTFLLQILFDVLHKHDPIMKFATIKRPRLLSANSVCATNRIMVCTWVVHESWYNRIILVTTKWNAKTKQ